MILTQEMVRENLVPIIITLVFGLGVMIWITVDMVKSINKNMETDNGN